MTGRSIALNQKWAAEREHAAGQRALTRDFGAYAPVGEIWARQTDKACTFKGAGVIAKSLLRWRKPDGSVVAWDQGYDGDTLIAPVWAMKRAER